MAMAQIKKTTVYYLQSILPIEKKYESCAIIALILLNKRKLMQR